MTHTLILSILSEALHCAEISEREFYNHCRLAGIEVEKAERVVAELREHDGVENV